MRLRRSPWRLILWLLGSSCQTLAHADDLKHCPSLPFAATNWQRVNQQLIITKRPPPPLQFLLFVNEKWRSRRLADRLYASVCSCCIQVIGSLFVTSQIGGNRLVWWKRPRRTKTSVYCPINVLSHMEDFIYVCQFKSRFKQKHSWGPSFSVSFSFLGSKCRCKWFWLFVTMLLYRFNWFNCTDVWKLALKSTLKFPLNIL